MSDATPELPTLISLNILHEQALTYARELSALYRQHKAERQELEAKMTVLTELQEQAVAYARDMSQTFRQERERARQVQDALGELTATYDATLTALVTALDMRDIEVGDHSQRVVRYTLAIAGELGLAPDQEEEVSRGALLHDIGKIGVRDSILRKKGHLSLKEWAEMRKHCLLGYSILKDVPFLQGAAEMVYTHHERYDGAGYPRGLSGKTIPLGARIFAVADSLDAMTSPRPYRESVSLEQGVDEIVKCTHTQFDPEVTEAFLLAVRNGRIAGGLTGGSHA